MSMLKLYYTKWCPDCHAAIKVLEEKNINFEKIDIDGNPDAVKTVTEAMGKKMVPVLERNGKFIDGNHFEMEKFEKDLEYLLG